LLITPYFFPILTTANNALLFVEIGSAEEVLVIERRITNPIDLNVKLIKDFII